MICPHCQTQNADVPKTTICPRCKIPYDTSRYSPHVIARKKRRAGLVDKHPIKDVLLKAFKFLLFGVLLNKGLLKLSAKLIGSGLIIAASLKFCSWYVDQGSDAPDKVREGFFMILLFLGALSFAMVGSEGKSLHQKFIKLGILTGKTEAEIINSVGNPSARSVMAGGDALLQWQATGFHIALVFDANRICKGISHEFVHRD